MPQVSLEIRKKRAKLLRSLGQKNYQTLLKNQVNKKHMILIETENGIGRTENNIKVKTTAEKKGNIIEVQPNLIKNDYLVVN